MSKRSSVILCIEEDGPGVCLGEVEIRLLTKGIGNCHGAIFITSQSYNELKPALASTSQCQSSTQPAGRREAKQSPRGLVSLAAKKGRRKRMFLPKVIGQGEKCRVEEISDGSLVVRWAETRRHDNLSPAGAKDAKTFRRLYREASGGRSGSEINHC